MTDSDHQAPDRRNTVTALTSGRNTAGQAVVRALDVDADESTKYHRMTEYIDGHGLNGQILSVAASGFFTDSYNLFAPNAILPCLAYIYWDGTRLGSEQKAIVLNILTLTGSAMGQVLFGCWPTSSDARSCTVSSSS
ncbi:hypothetical protein BAUCODRAFT_263334 [Baudoinia panamericana UAMH 10762]|uniref:Major facilitator superfamily (MFS) profile domain-containing protein n=1 Tax=Baudoinia panamericana (strain UAMH 10762) TaxID=717646 RepID=M2M8U8_BAUPA|nr:uncharacterized protein BAUCODRAFT_263334 [Baudoinia panamericana UAMH 10762]EMC92831.1 hypothetical protein BAUCODRAFT_263334 [Baudoinia panamericana UAMH 10762]